MVRLIGKYKLFRLIGKYKDVRLIGEHHLWLIGI